MSSVQPRKQRKRIYAATTRERNRMVSAMLSEEYAKQLNRKTLPVRKGDQVMVMRGAFRKLRGAVTRVDLKKLRAYVEGAKAKKVNGAEVQVPLHPSNLMITKPLLDDKRRQKMLQRTAAAPASVKKA